MELLITDKAWGELEAIQPQTSSYLLLWYDTEGCGCGVNGMATIRFVKQRKSSYKCVFNPRMLTFVEEQQEIFFSDKLTLDYEHGLFRLKSQEGILNPFISKHQLITKV
ncbi:MULTISPECIES: iron-sulfur cluster biosynthesis family protein [Clostridia]|uniref:iron-sulfur cluster biosynthesis family protein n=1 Tax=Clostridia TaxID=186801 RepID=UPI000EA335BC|nr:MULTISPECIES: iron-sulfur cluster biosynthesis family protein [Clostridia]NBJ70230.1 iron-sulfur cluster biosynthesis family protein [Roseburia sp. 1XD42-34]RKI76970.1 iron-sulfur cluster biosynthesis family protein [Clostridium sp. 1xD42-85]